MAMAFLANGCIPHVNEEVVRTPHPSLTESPHKLVQRREADPSFNASISGNVLSVRVEQRTECQSQISAPMEEDIETKRSLQSGFWAQTANLVTAGALVASGVAVYAASGGPCTTTPTATMSNSNPTPVPCSADQQQQQTSQSKGIGVVVATSAILPLGAFIWNLVRAHDDKATRTLATKTTTTEWETCNSKPLSNAKLTLTVPTGNPGGADSTFSTTTDDQGRAQLDLSSLRSVSDQAQHAVMTPQGPRASEVSLKGSAMRTASDADATKAAWAQAKLDDQEAQRVALERERVEQRAAVAR